ncbi:DNA-binding protein [Aestuariicella hydrocarbonica]|uniref:DNA-binding protein n=1 Tax=Pseudomaricurvus hydrocarbonicus TaxID=1470433 RepID=A0A9E5JWL1_9GAMM|nr:OB-fold domain-containing protein [Aestuariicella hydrocarbonica]NHO66826.1 DNA-binding protein [Aestuariicella hydrocarbonica]
MTSQIAIQEGLFSWPSDHPELLGSRCQHCGEASFPSQPDCRCCGQRDTQIVSLGHRGKLWTWTIQSFMPKPPYATDETAESFTPYGVGYVEMPGGVRVEGRIQLNPAAPLTIGMPLDLVVEPLRTDADGNQIMMFSFKPVEE